jgi:hypothetical protein
MPALRIYLKVHDMPARSLFLDWVLSSLREKNLKRFKACCNKSNIPFLMSQKSLIINLLAMKLNERLLLHN